MQSLVGPETWPTPYDPARAATLNAVLRQVLQACLDFAHTP